MPSGFFNARVQLLLFVAVLFVIIGSPATYKLTSKVTSLIRLRTDDAVGTPTNLGLIVHALVFTALFHLFLKLPTS